MEVSWSDLWEDVPGNSITTRAVYGHAAVALSPTHVLVLGGKLERRTRPEEPLPVHLFDAQHRRWSVLTKPHGTQSPCIRWGHCACLISSGVLLLGGFNSVYNLCDCWLFQPMSWTWCKVALAHKIEVRSYASAVAVSSTAAQGQLPDSMIVFGGQWCNGGPYEYLDEILQIHHVDASQHARMRASTLLPQCSGDGPKPRAQHLAAATHLLGGRHMVVAGGCNANFIFDDVWSLCLDRWSWSRLQCSGVSPLVSMHRSPEQNFRVAPLRQLMLGARGGLMVVSEGDDALTAIHLLDLDRHKWQLIEQCRAPEWRNNSAAVRLGREVFVFGGIASKSTSRRNQHEIEVGEASMAVNILRVRTSLWWPHVRLLFQGLSDSCSSFRILAGLPQLVQLIMEFLHADQDLEAAV